MYHFKIREKQQVMGSKREIKGEVNGNCCGKLNSTGKTLSYTHNVGNESDG